MDLAAWTPRLRSSSTAFVHDITMVPLAWFGAYWLRFNLETIPESDREVLSMNYHDDVMYAPTAAMLYQFREVAIEGRATRVLHFDQPLFAWK